MTNLSRFFLVITILGFANSSNAQIVNLLKNPNADEGAQFWRAFGHATIELCPNSSFCFALRDGGYFVQDVTIPEDAAGQYALLVGSATSDSLITGLPYLYGYMMNEGDPGGGRIYAYLSGQQMRSSAKSPGEWVNLWGIFKVKPGTARIRLFLMQESRAGSAHNGSAARFDQLALYILPDEFSARAFVGPASAIFAGPTKAAPSCTAPRQSFPPLYGLRLGMTIDQVLELFPGTEEDSTVRRAVDLLETQRVTARVPMFLNPHLKGLNQELQDIENFFLVFRERRLFRIDANFLRPGSHSTDEFIENYRHLLNMPDSSKWESVDGNPGKYLICDGIEVRFFRAHSRASQPSRIMIIDTTVEGKSLKEPSLQQQSPKPRKE